MTGTASTGVESPDPTWRIVHVWAAVPYVLAGIAAIAAIIALGHEIHAHLLGLENWIRQLGVFGPVAFVVVFAFATSVFVPDSLMSIAAGVLFGLWLGFVAVIAGGVISAMLQYGLGRYFLGGPLARMVGRRPKLQRLLEAIRHDQLRMQVLVRLTPVSPALVSYLLGASKFRLLPFVAALCTLAPAYFVQTYVGAAGKRAVHLTGQSASPSMAKEAMFFGGLLACAVVMMLITRFARRAIDTAESSVNGPIVSSP